MFAHFCDTNLSIFLKSSFSLQKEEDLKKNIKKWPKIVLTNGPIM